MEQKELFDDEGIICLEAVHGEEDLKIRPGINLNAPPADGRCHCCERHLGQLKPFGKAGDPLVGDFDGALLVKTFRRDFPRDEEIDKILEKFFGNCNSDEDYEKAKMKLVEEYGQDEAECMLLYESYGWVSKSWECRDCICLSEKRYHRIRQVLYEVWKSIERSDK